MTITIEPYRPEDRAAVEAFNAATQEHERVLAPDLKTGDEIAVPYTAETLRRVAENNGVILMARDGARAVGFICAYVDSDDDMLLGEHARQHGYVCDLFVEREYRRRGIARRLLQEVEDALRARGCTRMRICSKARNHAAVQCYENFAFRAYEVILEKPLI